MIETQIEDSELYKIDLNVISNIPTCENQWLTAEG
jgi:hypothetical protein